MGDTTDGAAVQGGGREPGAWVTRFEGASRWVRALLLAAAMSPLVVAIAYAIAPERPRFTPGVVMILVPALSELVRGRVRDRALRGLRPEERHRVVRTVLTGVPDGTPALDERAAVVMDKRPSDPPRVRGALNVVGLAGVVGIFVAAALRDHAWWYALGVADVAALVAIAYSATAYPREAAMARFDSFRTPLRPGA